MRERRGGKISSRVHRRVPPSPSNFAGRGKRSARTYNRESEDELGWNGVPSCDGEELELGSEDGDLLDVNERVDDGEEIEFDMGEEGAVEGEVSKGVDSDLNQVHTKID